MARIELTCQYRIVSKMIPQCNPKRIVDHTWAEIDFLLWLQWNSPSEHLAHLHHWTRSKCKYNYNRQCSGRCGLQTNQENLLSDICNAETGNIPATAALPRKVDWNLTPSSSLNAMTCTDGARQKQNNINKWYFCIGCPNIQILS